MLSIPFLSSYIQKVVKEQPVADSVDWLNYYCTSILLAFFALAISAKQYFGQAINCWVPNEFKGGWEKYAEDYCFITNSYYVPFDEEVPTDLSKRTDQISYYRWVPIVLALQAVFFWLPNWLWNMLHKQTAVSARQIVNEARKSGALAGPERDAEIQGLAAYISDTISVFSEPNSRRPSGLNATMLYLAIKLLYVLNCFGQLMTINRFLGGQYYSWAYETTLSLFQGQDWPESAVFPRVIMCDFSIRRLANPQRHTIQCVIMLNMINEKLYYFLYFWFLLVACVTLVNFLYYMAMLLLPSLRTQFVMRNINKQQHKLRGLGRHEIDQFVQYRLRPDGILLLHFLRQHIGGRVTYDLLNELLRLYWISIQHNGNASNQTSTGNGSLSHGKLSNASSSPPGSAELLLSYRGKPGAAGVTPAKKMHVPSMEEEEGTNKENNNNGTSYSRQDTYKPTAYGPRSALMYPVDSPNGIQEFHQSPSAPFYNSASLLRALGGIAAPTNPDTGGTNPNPYTMPPTLDYIDGTDGNAAAENYRTPKSATTVSHHGTPLMSGHSRRAKSPLVTGLGSIGKRQSPLVNYSKTINNNNPTTQDSNDSKSTDSEV